MISKNSFWDNKGSEKYSMVSSIRENQKRRTLVWIVAWLLQIFSYVGVILVYLSRIRARFEQGYYAGESLYKSELMAATQDALGFSNLQFFTMFVLAAVIGMQGFSYLFDRRKVDMYHSVPVSKEKRFMTIYLGGILIYVLPTIVSILLGFVVAGAYQAISGSVVVAVLLRFVYNLVSFLVMYHIMILAVMLTGTMFISGCGYMVLMFYEEGAVLLFQEMKNHFFHTADYYFDLNHRGIAIIRDYFHYNNKLIAIESIGEYAKSIAPYLLKWLIVGAVLLVIAYICYCKRRSEVAGRAMAFSVTEPVIKIMLAVPAALMFGLIVYETSANNNVLMIVSFVLGTLIAGCVIEMIYAYDVKAAIKHPFSTAAGVLIVIAMFIMYQQDVFGYDHYVPKAEQIESYAFVPQGMYVECWNEEYHYQSPEKYNREHMFVTDTEAITALASKSVETMDQMDFDNRWDARNNQFQNKCYFYVLYRLKSGREVARQYVVDMSDASNCEYLDRIMGTREYQAGIYQVMTDDNCCSVVSDAVFSNGAVDVAIPLNQLPKIRDAWIKDMEKYNYTYIRDHYPCGKVNITFDHYMTADMFLYDNFEETINCLKELNLYYPLQLNAEDVESVKVVNHHSELSEAEDYAYDDLYGPMYGGAYATKESVAYEQSANFTDTDKIAQILENCYPANLDDYFYRAEGFESDYDVEIAFKRDSAYPYARDNLYFWYRFHKGQVPDFVVEATALEE